MIGEITRIAGGLHRHAHQLHFAVHLLVALLITGAVGFLTAPAAQALMVTGSYIGNGLDNRSITGAGFQPDVVIIKSSDHNKEAVCRTASMTGDNTKPLGANSALTPDQIQSLDADGFTIGTDDEVNSNGKAYHWIAFKQASGELVVSSYTGNGADNRSITSVGFQPDYVIVMSSVGKEPVHRSSAQSGDSTLWFKNVAPTANLIQAFEANGFQVGSDDNVNKLGVTFHYNAWKAVAGKMAVASYTGDALDDREITGLGFKPAYVIIKDNNNKEAVHRSDTVSGDSTLWFIPQVAAPNMIQALQFDGFQVGNDDNVNKDNTRNYYWIAFSKNYHGDEVSLSSATNQLFGVGNPPRTISTITVVDEPPNPTISGTWDSSDQEIPQGLCGYE
jgi:hypothetical protein